MTAFAASNGGGERPPDRRGRGTAGARAPASPRAKARGFRWDWGLVIALIGVIVALAAWLWPVSPDSHQPVKPPIYAVRVQVDPQGHFVKDATVAASHGEPQRLPSGWWQIEIPRAKVPADGRVLLSAEHESWDEGRKILILGEDPNLSTAIHLKQPETWLRGQVVDEDNQALSGVHVTRQDGAPGDAITSKDGHFALKLAVPQDTPIRLRTRLGRSASEDTFCHAGRDTCSITLGTR